MSPRMEADFDWADDVQASVPVYPKGEYEVTIHGVRASAWPKTDSNGNPTGEVTKVIRLIPRIKGVYDSKGKLKTELNGKVLADAPAEDINLWVHSEGGRRQAKKAMMAIAGYNPNDPAQEKEFNSFLKTSKLDLSTKLEEAEDGKLSLIIGDGWETLLKGKNVRASMDIEIRQIEGKEPVEQQNYRSLSPVN